MLLATENVGQKARQIENAIVTSVTNFVTTLA